MTARDPKPVAVHLRDDFLARRLDVDRARMKSPSNWSKCSASKTNAAVVLATDNMDDGAGSTALLAALSLDRDEHTAASAVVALGLAAPTNPPPFNREPPMPALR